MSTGANHSRKRKYKPRNPPGPDRAKINWKEEEFQNLVRDMGFRSEWGAQFPTPNSTALDAPPGYIALYVAYFREGNFRLPMTKFTGEVLTNYGLHISQINALGLPRITHFEFICRANRIELTFEMFNVFYFVSYTGGFYSFNSRTGGVSPCSTNLPKSLHDWKHKFFYIHRGVIPIDMHYREGSEGVPRVNVSIDFAQQKWYKVLTRKVTSITQLEERVLVAAGMSMLWGPQNPRGVPVYGYQGKVGYSLMNVLDPNAGGAMVVAYLPEGRPVWLDQIRDYFLHPTSESLAAYANTVLGEDGGDDLDHALSPTREEVIVLSSEGSDRSREGLIPRSPRAGPSQGAVNEPVNEPAGDDVDVPADAAEQVESRKKKKADTSEKKKKKKVEEPVTRAPRKQPSNFSLLDYVVVSDTLSGLDAGDKHAARDPDDDATLTEIVKRKKGLEDKKRELDEQATAALAEKKSRSQKETTAAPSESEVDLGVFSAKSRNLLEKIYKSASGSRGVKSGNSAPNVVISKITLPTSPPSRIFDLSPPHADLGKRKEDDVEVEQVEEGGAGDGGRGGGGDGGDGGRGGSADIEVESSEITPHHTIYTKVVRGSGEGGASGTHHSPEYEHVQGGSWDTHNLACADLPHAPRWNLTQGSRMTDLGNCREFFSLSPLLKDCFRRDAIGWISWMIISTLGSTFLLPLKRLPGNGS
ncbi:hypothetical protein HanHA300_Chr03g0078771 [Helianthus annuus]|nr:hypothetical protein HanHA300_Chr03g0078771 [Helianthus annuus]KAJ0766947.1 hypothetical protein HanLR1_Chr03g0083441 [Helianthus annuus]